MPKPMPPEGWEQVRAWLLELDDPGRRYVLRWLGRWVIARSGALTPQASSTQHSARMDPFKATASARDPELRDRPADAD
jgi:hypothetical protein